MKLMDTLEAVGKARFTTVALAALAILGVCAFFGTDASAQGGGKVSMNDWSFGPAPLEPIDPNMPFASESMDVGLLLPAVHILNEPAAQMEVIADGAMMTVPAFGRSERSLAKLRIWMERDPRAPGFIVNVQDQGGDVRRMPIEHRDLVIRVRGATQGNRTYVEPETASVRHNTVGGLTGSGGTQPIIIGLLIPAVQKVR